MKVLYYSPPGFADNNFTLYKAMRDRGVDFTYLMSMMPGTTKSPVFEIKNVINKNAIIKASEYKELQIFEKYMDFSHFYILNRNKSRSYSFTAFLMTIKLIQFIRKEKFDVIHITYPLWASEILLYFFRHRMVLTVHDPIPHSGEKSLIRNVFRTMSFKLIPNLILLNEFQENEFVDKYNLNNSRIYHNCLGRFDFLDLFKDDVLKSDPNLILFYGRISPYKGVEYLCQAMEIVHKEIPQAKLIIAGKGNMYFDFAKFSDKSYICFYNRFIDLIEVTELLQKCAFTVCPYTDATQSGVVLMSFTMGKPVVATRIEGFSKVIIDGENGVLVKPKDYVSLASGILELLKNRDKVVYMAQSIKEHFFSNERSWEGITERCLNIYDSIIKS